MRRDPRAPAALISQTVKPDLRVENHLSLFLLWPLTDRAGVWIEENVSEDRLWFGTALVVEPRYVTTLIEGMTLDGLILTGGSRQ